MNRDVVIMLISMMLPMAFHCRADQDIVMEKENVTFNIMPPENLQAEEWQFCRLTNLALFRAFDSKSMPFSVILEYDTIPVYVIQDVDNGEIYFKGLVGWSSYSRSSNGSNSLNFTIPDAWVKANICNDTIIFPISQQSCEFDYEDNHYSFSLRPSWIWRDFYHGSNTNMSDTYCDELKEDLKFIKSSDSDAIVYQISPRDFDPSSYSGDGRFRGLGIFNEKEKFRQYGYSYQNFPESSSHYGGKGFGIYADAIFVKKGEAGIGYPISQDVESSHPYYDLHGRKYLEKPSHPGIYIHNARKFIIK